MSIIGRTSRAIRVIWHFYKLPLNYFRYYCPHPADSDHPTVLQYLSASFGTSALKLPCSCYFIFPHRYGLWSPSMVQTFFMFVPHLFDFLSVTDNTVHCSLSAIVLRCHRLLMIIQEATRTTERPLWIGVLLDGYEIVWITDGRDRESGASMGVWWIFVQENCSAWSGYAMGSLMSNLREVEVRRWSEPSPGNRLEVVTFSVLILWHSFGRIKSHFSLLMLICFPCSKLSRRLRGSLFHVWSFISHYPCFAVPPFSCSILIDLSVDLWACLLSRLRFHADSFSSDRG